MNVNPASSTILSVFNKLDSPNTYYVPDTNQEFEYNHNSGTVTNVQQTSMGKSQTSLGKEILSALAKYVGEHYPSQSGYGVFPLNNEELAIVLVDNCYNPSNFWNGRWKAHYIFDGDVLKGEIHLDIHYFEDGNVRLKTNKKINREPLSSCSSRNVVDLIAAIEKKYQDEINHTLVGLNDGAFKSLRRQLPVTRSKMTWGKAIGNYRLGQDIAGQEN